MEQLIARCAGIDVGQAESMVCVRVPLDQLLVRRGHRGPAELIRQLR
jgi:hypothetical protein